MSSTSDQQRFCPKCGKSIAIDSPQGLCAPCLLRGISFPTDSPTHVGRRTPPDKSEVAKAFPQLEILNLVGQGGMGFVFKARQPKLDRMVALKILAENLAGEPGFSERFAQEGRLLARLNHPNIVSVHDFGCVDGFFYLIMEFVDGLNLRQILQSGRFTPDQALGIVPAICEALQFAHGEGILHRDIKPENILINTRGRVKIADFGIAKLLGDKATSSLTGTGATLGTPHYMAPEQIEAPASVDHRADIFSLGVVFYEMLTGELPLGRFAPPSQKSGADVRLDDLVFKSLEKEPSRRQQTAHQVKTEVEEVVSNPAGGNPSASAATGTESPLRSSECYLSTPARLNSFVGHLYIYDRSGSLRLDSRQLAFVDSLYTKAIPLASIEELAIGQYPWAAKPTRLDFISVGFTESGEFQRLFFTPHLGKWKPTWTTNEHVAEWFQQLQDSIKRARGTSPRTVASGELYGHGKLGFLNSIWCLIIPILTLLLFVLFVVLLHNQSDIALALVIFVVTALVKVLVIGGCVYLLIKYIRNEPPKIPISPKKGFGMPLILGILGVFLCLPVIFVAVYMFSRSPIHYMSDPIVIRPPDAPQQTNSTTPNFKPPSNEQR